MYEFPQLEITSAQNRVHAQIIGNSGLAKKVQSLLKNQKISAVLSLDFPDRPYLPDSPLPDYVYWFLTQNSHKFPQTLVNFLKSSQAKLIIIRAPDHPRLAEAAGEGGPDFPDIPADLLSSFLDLGLDACQVFVKDVYGPSIVDSDLSLIWRDLKSKFVIDLPDDDSAEIYPIYIDDAAAAIIKTSFSTQTYGRTFYITGSDKTTVLSFSYRLREEVVRQTQKLPPVNYTPSQLHSVFSIQYSVFNQQAASTRAFLSWRPETDLSEGLTKLVSSLNPSRPSIPSAPSVVSKPASTGSRRNFIKKKTIQRFRRAFVIPAVLATAFFAATISLPRLLDYLAASLAKTFPDRLARFETVFTLFGRRQQFFQLEAAAALDLKQLELSNLASGLLESIITQSSIPPDDILNQLDSRSTSLLKSLPSGETRRLLGLARELIPAVRPILTSPQKQTFLIVFQNSAELRPTGGFISSLAFVTLQKGKILDIDYQSVDQLDSQLVGAETPPDPIKTYLGDTNWLIRDANWSPPADQSAQKLQSLIARASGRNLSGVIFLTTPALEQILVQTGEIPAPDGSVWNQLNLPQRLVYNDAASQFTSLARALEEFIKTNPRRQKVIPGTLKAIDHQNLLISLLDYPNLPDFPDSSDSLQIIDANLGANQADYFVAKEHDIAISLSDSQTASAMTLRYANPPSSSQYPAGTYRNYVRVYLPSDSIITSLVRLSPDGLVAVPTDNAIENDRKSVGWFMEIPPGGQEIFRLEYTRPVKLTLQDQTALYALTVFKQPGTAVPVSISIDYPENLVPLVVSDQVTVAQNKLLATHSGDTNLNLNVEFTSDIISP